MAVALDSAMREIAKSSCTHAKTEDLGWGGPAHYRRCAACGTVLIESQGGLWQLRPVATA